MVLLLSPLTRGLIKLRLWLFLHGFVWLAMHLFGIVRFALVYGVVALLVSGWAREIWLLWMLPGRARRFASRGETEKAIRLMRRSVKAFTPLLGTRPLYLKRAYLLGQMLENTRRTGEANEVWEEIARRKGLAPGFEADVRKRWANGLETLGDFDAAARQRAIVEDRLAQSEAQGGGDNWPILLERGKSASEANRHPEALTFFERALSAPKIGVLTSQRDAIDVEIACRVALAAHSAGNNERAESAARFVIAGANASFWRAQGFRTLALALGTQNRLQEALEASRAAFEQLEKVGDTDQLADARANYAMLLMQSGQVQAALDECEAAAHMGLHSSRMALHLAANCHMLRGNYNAARDFLERARRASPVVNPAVERQMQGLLDFEGAGIERSATRFGGEDRAQLAWDLLQRAKPNLEGFERLLYWHSAAEMMTLAMLGHPDRASEMRFAIEARLADFENDPATLNAIWTWLAATNQLIGQHEEAVRWNRVYLETPFGRPVFRADVLCNCGESLCALGDEDGARRCWQDVLNLGFDIAATRRAQKLLDEVTSSNPT